MLIIVYIAFLSTVFTYIDNYNIRNFSVLRLFISYKKTKARIREISDSDLLIIRIYQNDLKSSIAFAGSAALKTAVPATHTSTPASDACSMVSLPIPPSASIRILFRPLR